ncbi:MAG TPA: DUF1629 domain-containing protein [Archangium sp.]|uniref:imm11 family protein n=1 Tax=Archangium sp. TaxID=1872627 RepID=UPI002E2F60D2|nr:DUF1629 domain-containing protein [Archangium sp.]HEX5751900.1 DUF1629 domain-containing protein [Archangium sp.]
MAHGYLSIYLNTDRRNAIIKDIGERVAKSWELTEGTVLKDSLPESTTFSLSQDSGDILCDFIPNISSVLVISSRAREVLEAQGLRQEMEYLPITVLDRRGRPTKSRYYLANVLRKVACMDREKSEFVPGSDEEILVVERLKLQEELIPPETRLFRLGECPEVIIIRSDLLQHIQAENLTGLVVREQGEDIY